MRVVQFKIQFRELICVGASFLVRTGFPEIEPCSTTEFTKKRLLALLSSPHSMFELAWLSAFAPRCASKGCFIKRLLEYR